MVITKTPFRISFFGGGTDFPNWYEKNDSVILSTTIDKYCYLACRFLPPFFTEKYRIVYSETELVKCIDEIKHPVIRSVLRYLNYTDKGIEVIHYADLPARTGIGSSSSFTVGLLNALNILNDKHLAKHDLAMQAIEIEQKILKESVGSQDQIAAAYGGMNLIHFSKSDIKVTPVIVADEKKSALESSCLLFYSGISRFSSEITKKHIENIPNKQKELKELTKLSFQGYESLISTRSIDEFGYLLDETWKLKKRFSNAISTPLIDHIYAKAKLMGALGGKVIGAGGGGFILLFAKPELHSKIILGLDGYLNVPFKFENSGSSFLNL